jgi:hypothetical protein
VHGGHLLLASNPEQEPMANSAAIHWTAPSPTVKPAAPAEEHRHRKLGLFPHEESPKLVSRNETKHRCAQVGTVEDSSSDKCVDEAIAANESIINDKKYNEDGTGAILEGNIWRPCGQQTVYTGRVPPW